MLDKLTPEQIQAYKDAGVLDAMIEAYKNDVNSNVPYNNPAYSISQSATGGFGIFSQPGVNPRTFDATAQPFDFVNVLTPTPSEFREERVGILTGQQATGGSNPSENCGTPARPGNLKTCQQNYVFGEFYLGSDKINITRAGEKATRAVSERIIQNAALDDVFMPDVLRINPTALNFNSPEAVELYKMGTAFRRAISRVAITGNPATAYTSTELGFIQEFNGLDTIIKTGYTDAITGDTCAAADSDVRTWGALTTATVGGNSIVTELTDLYFGRVMVARQVGMSPTFAFIMRFDLFRELTYAYASNYFISRLTGAYNAAYNLETNSEVVRRLQIEMLQGNYLLIDGVQVPVLFSDGITPTSAGNYRESDIYLIALSDGGAPLVQFDYFNMNNENVSALASRFGNEITVTNNGMFALAVNRTNFCIEYVLTGRVRMFHWTPFLCGRLDNVQYTSNIKYRAPHPAGTGYVNGGVTYYSND